MPTFKKNPNPIMKKQAYGTARTPFKLKSSPTKGKLDDLFKGLHTKLQTTSKKHQDWKAKRAGSDEDKTERAAGYKDHMSKKYGTGDYAASGSKAKERMKAGESKFQYDVRMKKAKKKTTPKTTPKTRTEYVTAPKPPPKGKEAVSPTPKPTPKPKTKVTGALGSKTRKEQYDAKGWKYDDTIKGYNRDGTKKKKKKPSYKTIKGKHGPVSVIDDETTESLPTSKKKPKFEPVVTQKPEEKVINPENFYSKDHPRFNFTKTNDYSPVDKKSPTKKSGFKMKSSPAKIFDTKGKRRKNYKY